ncbi:MAG: hypothetical protein ACKO6B_16210 [Planctomycetia bacterium]
MIRVIRNAFIAMAVVAVAFSVDAALAGGNTRGMTKAQIQNVRIKNTGTAPVLVNAINGTATAAGGKTIAGNGIAVFRVKKGAAEAFAQNQAGSASQTLPFSFPKSQFVYLLAAADATTSTLTFSPPGKIF